MLAPYDYFSVLLSCCVCLFVRVCVYVFACLCVFVSLDGDFGEYWNVNSSPYISDAHYSIEHTEGRRLEN